MNYVQRRTASIEFNYNPLYANGSTSSSLGSFGSIVKTPFNAETKINGTTEFDHYMTKLLGINPSHLDFITEARSYWARISIPVTREKRELNISLEWPSEEIYRKYKDLDESQLFMHASPCDLTAYVQWRFAMIHPHVAKVSNNKYVKGAFTARLYNDSEIIAQKQLRVKQKNEADLANYELISHEDATVKTLAILNACRNNADLFTKIQREHPDLVSIFSNRMVNNLDETTVDTAIRSIRSINPELFIAMVRQTTYGTYNFQWLFEMNIIYLGIESGVIKRMGEYFFFEQKQLASGLDDMIMYVSGKNPANTVELTTIKIEIARKLGQTKFDKLLKPTEITVEN